ncbi:MAG: amino acid ABC transporter substrate-binding protein [Solirubrobacteraceae bacterium]
MRCLRSVGPWLGIACALALVVAGCGKGAGNAGGGGGTKGGKLQVGAALSLTGSLAKEGRLTKLGYQLCQDKVNSAGGVAAGGKKVKLAITYKDDKSQPDAAAQLVDQFNDSGRKLILGPYGSPSTEAASAVVERNGQVMIDSSGADNSIFSKGYKNTFAVLAPATSYLAVIVKAIADNASPKPKTVAIISADDGFSKTAAKGGAAEIKKQGMKLLTTAFVAQHTTNVSSALTKIRPMKPDLILVSAHVEEGIAAVKQSNELGVRPMGFGETVAPPTPDFVKALGKQAEGVVGSTQWTPDAKGKDKVFTSAQQYAQDFKQRFGETAEYHSAEAAAACLALVLGVEKAASTDPAKVRDAIAGLDTDSFFGPIKFDTTGKNADKPMSAIQIQKGKPVTIYPADQAQAKLQWPAGG